MPDSGIPISNESYQRLQGDVFSQEARGRIADEFGAQVQAALAHFGDVER